MTYAFPRFRGDLRLPRTVAASPRLADLLPTAKLEALLAKYAAAQAAAETAAAIRLEDVDVRVQTQQAIDRGEDIDVPAAFQAMAASAAQAAAFGEASSFFRGLPDQYVNAVAQLIQGSTDDLYDGLEAQLTVLLDEAEEVAADLDGAFDAESAMDADKLPAFARWRDLSRDYAALRADHTDLLAATGKTNTDHWPFAFFAAAEVGDPDLIRRIRNEAPSTGWRTSAYEPFPMADPASRDHFVAAVTLRSTLQPYVGRGEEAEAARKAAWRRQDLAGVPLADSARVDR